jgi:predicted lipoprotein
MSKAKDIMTVLIGRVVVYAKGKINKSQNWSEAEIEKALSPESLTMAADSWATNMMPYHQEMSRAFKLEKSN